MNVLPSLLSAPLISRDLDLAHPNRDVGIF